MFVRLYGVYIFRLGVIVLLDRLWYPQHHLHHQQQAQHNRIFGVGINRVSLSHSTTTTTTTTRPKTIHWAEVPHTKFVIF